MKNVDKDLEQLKLYSVEDLMNAYSFMIYARDKTTGLEIDLNEALEDLKNELKTRPVEDLIEWMIDEKRL